MKTLASDSLGDTDMSGLRVLLKKFDTGKKGHLSHAEFKALMGFSQVNLNLEEEYAIMSEYDPELRSVFNYNLLLKSLIDKLCD